MHETIFYVQHSTIIKILYTKKKKKCSECMNAKNSRSRSANTRAIFFTFRKLLLLLLISPSVQQFWAIVVLFIYIFYVWHNSSFCEARCCWKSYIFSCWLSILTVSNMHFISLTAPKHPKNARRQTRAEVITSTYTAPEKRFVPSSSLRKLRSTIVIMPIIKTIAPPICIGRK